MFLDEKRQGESQVGEEWRDRLLEAAQRLREDGWFSLNEVVHVNAPLRGRHCALTAIHYKADDVADLAAKKLVEYLRLPPPIDDGHWRSPIPYWNDAPGRTVEQVIEALEGAARMP